MFEFDEHYLELDLLDRELPSFIIEDASELTAEWLYLSHEIWKMVAAPAPQEQLDQLAS